MSISAYYPYRSAAARDAYVAHCDEVAAAEWPVASEERLVATSFGETFVRVSGPEGAPPLVLLPGATATSLLWAPNIGPLSRACRTYAVDRLGDVGRSRCTRALRGADDAMTWMDELLDGLQLTGGVHLMGISLGSWLAAKYAIRSPQRVKKVVLLAPAATVLRFAPAFLLRGLMAWMGGRRMLRSMMTWMCADLHRKDPRRMEVSVDRAMLATRSMRPTQILSPTVLSDAELAGLGMPVLLLVGEHEKLYDAARAMERLQRVAPQIQAEMIPGAGHDLTIVQAEMVNRKVVEFLRSQ